MQNKLSNILNLKLENYDFEGSLKKFLLQLAEKYNPAMVILSGSLARGDYWHDSDVDLVVVLNRDRVNPVADGIQLRRNLDYDFALDLFVYGKEQFKNMLNFGNLVALDAMEFGKILYVGNQDYYEEIKKLWNKVRKEWEPTEFGWRGVQIENNKEVHR